MLNNSSKPISIILLRDKGQQNFNFKHLVCILCVFRIASSNNTSKSESDQEDNDDINDNDWSYGSEKKRELTRSVIYFNYVFVIQ